MSDELNILQQHLKLLATGFGYFLEDKEGIILEDVKDGKEGDKNRSAPRGFPAFTGFHKMKEHDQKAETHVCCKMKDRTEQQNLSGDKVIENHPQAANQDQQVDGFFAVLSHDDDSPDFGI